MESFALTEPITVPENKNIAIFSVQGSETTVSRGAVTGDMFKVSPGSILSMTKNDGDGTTTIVNFLSMELKLMEHRQRVLLFL